MNRKLLMFCLCLTALLAGFSNSESQTLPPGQRPGTPTVQQTRPQITRKSIRFSGKGVTAANLKLTAAQMKAIASRKGPAPLAPAVKQQALDGKIGTPFATVSVGRLIEPNKARIEVWTPILVNSLTLANGVPRILFTSSQEWEQSNDLFHPTLFVFINSPAAGNFYLVDCSVTPGPYTIEGPSGTQTTQVEDGHLLFHLDQAALGWQSFRITSADQWEFYSCSILQLN